MKPIFVLCEGHHDVAFLGRLLSVAGVEPYKVTLGEYEPTSLSKFLIGRYRKRDIEGGRFRSSGSNKGTIVSESPPTLEAAYHLGDPDRLLLFFRCSGDQHTDAIREFLQGLVDLSSPGAPDVGLESFGVIFTGDADQIGVDERIARWRTEFGETLRPVLPNFSKIRQDTFVRDKEFSAACCVFSAPDQQTGTLEDIVWPILYANISPQLDAATNYVEMHGIEGTRVHLHAVKKRKAALTIAGQLDCPGYALSVVLRDSRAFDDEILRDDAICKKLLQTIMDI
jgi:hypothetical protein